MAPTRPLKPATALLLPAALLPWAAALAASGDNRPVERVICIANDDENPIEITDAKAMTRVVRWSRRSGDFGAPARPRPAHAPAAQRHWTLGPGMKAEFVVSGTSPWYVLALSNGRAQVHCTFDNYGGEPRLVGEAGLASLTRAGDHYAFAFEATRRPGRALDDFPEPQAEFVVRVELDTVPGQAVEDEARPGLPAQPSAPVGYQFIPAVDRLDAGQKQALIGLGNPPPRPARPRRPAAPAVPDAASQALPAAPDAASQALPAVPDAASQALPAVVHSAPVAQAMAAQAQDRPGAPASAEAAAWARKVRSGKHQHGWRNNPWQPSLAPVASGQRLAPADLPGDLRPQAAPGPRGRLAPIALHGDRALEAGSLKALREAGKAKRLEHERRVKQERRQKLAEARQARQAETCAPAQPDQPVMHADLMSLYGL